MQLEWLGTFVWVVAHNGVSAGAPVGHNVLASPLDGGERGARLLTYLVGLPHHGFPIMLT